MSDTIDELVSLAITAGGKVYPAQWSNAYVYWFDNVMPETVRANGLSNSSIEYFQAPRTPHDPATHGFIDRAAKRSISFYVEDPDA